MTDEEIEKGLKNPWYDGEYHYVMHCDVLDYINRLKAENERLMAAQVNRLKLLALQMKNGEIDMTFGSENCDAFIYSILQVFKQNGGENFVSTTVEVDGKDLGGKYALTIQKVGGLTPIEKVRKDTAKDILYTLIARAELSKEVAEGDIELHKESKSGYSKFEPYGRKESCERFIELCRQVLIVYGVEGNK